MASMIFSSAKCLKCSALRKLTAAKRKSGEVIEKPEFGHKWWPMCSVECSEQAKVEMQKYKSEEWKLNRMEKQPEKYVEKEEEEKEVPAVVVKSRKRSRKVA